MGSLGTRERGIVAVVVAIALLALVAMVGFALDSGHLVLNKARLQNTVDAAALTAAKVLDLTGSQAQAESAARALFDTNAASHAELDQVMSGSDVVVQFSNTLNPWSPGSTPANYVRVVADDFTMWTSFSSLVGITQTQTAASAVAGPSAPIGNEEGNEACDLVPLMVCADLAAGAAGDWGYSSNNVTLLKFAAGGSPNMGPGNYQILRLGGNGANVARQNLAGGYDECIDPSGTVETQPGNLTGPVAQGLNTRFGQYQGGGMNSTSYPPDKVTSAPSPGLSVANDDVTVVFSNNNQPVTHINQLSFSFNDYEARQVSGPFNFPSGKAQRRVVAVPFVDCTVPHQGQSTLPVVGLGCFFLLQPVVQQGNRSHVYAEYIAQCGADGTPGPDPEPDPLGGPGIYKIVLHNDPGSPDS